MAELLNRVWNERKMLAEIDRVEKLVLPHIHARQAGAPESMNEVRQFIRGRRAALRTALADWRPNIPREPRTPVHIVDIGRVTGSFSTGYSAVGSKRAAVGKVDVRVTLKAQQNVFKKVAVKAQDFQFPSVFRGAAPPVSTRPAPSVLVFTGTRDGNVPLSFSLTVPKGKFTAGGSQPIDVTGRMREVQSGGGLRRGSIRSLVGKVHFTEPGVKTGDPIAGTVDLWIVETRGGFQRRRQ